MHIKKEITTEMIKIFLCLLSFISVITHLDNDEVIKITLFLLFISYSGDFLIETIDIFAYTENSKFLKIFNILGLIFSIFCLFFSFFILIDFVQISTEKHNVDAITVFLHSPPNTLKNFYIPKTDISNWFSFASYPMFFHVLFLVRIIVINKKRKSYSLEDGSALK